MTTPAEGRIRSLNQAPLNKTAKYGLYWSQINRRVEGNHALAHAITLANQLRLPVLVYEGLTCTYREANGRIHTFVLEIVSHTAAALVTDDFPVFIVREHLESVPAKLKIPCLAVDSSTVVPMNHFEKREWAAYTIRPSWPNAKSTTASLFPRPFAAAPPLPASNLSPYLHFGMISPIDVALAARDYAADIRDPQYKREQFEQVLTHDDIWNAAPKELLLRGKILGYYRMYWGKKIIAWSPTCQDALETMIALHGRPWVERPSFGQIRYMGYDGMRRKTDSVSYLREIAHLEATSQDLLALA